MKLALWVLGFWPWVLGPGDFGIAVEAAAPDAFCPAVEATREALRARVGTIDVADGGSWRVLYTIVHSPGTSQGDQIRLELWDPNGALKLQRGISIAGESCATLAQIIALVIERYFRDLSTAGPNPELPETPEPEGSPGSIATTRPVAPTSARPRSEQAPLPLPPRPPSAHEVPVLAAGLFGGASTVTRAPGLGLGMRLHWGNLARLRASVHVPFRSHEEELGGGGLVLEEYPLRLGLTAGVESGDFELDLGPEILIALERGRADRLPDAAGGWRWVPGLGLRAGVIYWASPRVGIELGLSANAVARDLTSQFAVGSSDVLVPAPARGLIQLGMIWSMIK